MYVQHLPVLTDEGLRVLRAAAAPLPLNSRGPGFLMSPARDTQAALGHLLPAAFPGVLSRLILIVLEPGAQLAGHSDPPARAAGSRYHIPLHTNDRCWVFHDDTWSRLAVGHTYSMDPTKVHGAVNWGDTARVHLVLDTPAFLPS